MPSKTMIEKLIEELEDYLEEIVISPKEGATREFFDSIYKKDCYNREDIK